MKLNARRAVAAFALAAAAVTGVGAGVASASTNDNLLPHVTQDGNLFVPTTRATPAIAQYPAYHHKHHHRHH